MPVFSQVTGVSTVVVLHGSRSLRSLHGSKAVLVPARVCAGQRVAHVVRSVRFGLQVSARSVPGQWKSGQEREGHFTLPRVFGPRRRCVLVAVDGAVQAVALPGTALSSRVQGMVVKNVVAGFDAARVVIGLNPLGRDGQGLETRVVTSGNVEVELGLSATAWGRIWARRGYLHLPSR